MESKSSQAVEVASIQETMDTITESKTKEAETSSTNPRVLLESATESKAKEAVEETTAKQEIMETAAIESKAKQIIHEAAMDQNMESPKARTPVISIKNQEEFAREWQIRYTELSQYQSQHGHCSILNVNYDNESIQLVRRLCRWMIEQRQLRGEGLLSRARFDLLNLLDFDWSRKAHNDDLWMQSFFYLVDYKNKFGHCNVPQKKETQYQQLGRWVKKQREEGKRNALRADRVQKLNDIDFTWSFPTARFHLERMTNPSMSDASTADAIPSSTVTENAIAMGASINVAAATNNESMQQEQERLTSQEEQLRNYLEESKKRQMRMQQRQQQAPRPSKKQRMQEDVIVIDDDIAMDTDTEEGDDEEEGLASSRISGWNNEDDTILGELYHAQYQLYQAQSQMYHAQTRIDILKEKLATRMQSRSDRRQYKSTKHLEDELRKQQRKKQILHLELQRQQERKESSQSFNGAHHETLLDERHRQVQQRLEEQDGQGVSSRLKPAIVQPQQKTQTSNGVQATSLARDVSV